MCSCGSKKEFRYYLHQKLPYLPEDIRETKKGDREDKIKLKVGEPASSSNALASRHFNTNFPCQSTCYYCSAFLATLEVLNMESARHYLKDMATAVESYKYTQFRKILG